MIVRMLGACFELHRRLPTRFLTKLSSQRVGLVSLDCMSCQNSEFIALFTVSIFPWPESSNGRENEAPCWKRTAAATAAATGRQNGPRLSGSSSGYRCTPPWLRAGEAGDLSPRWASPRALSWHVLNPFPSTENRGFGPGHLPWRSPARNPTKFGHTF